MIDGGMTEMKKMMFGIGAAFLCILSTSPCFGSTAELAQQSMQGAGETQQAMEQGVSQNAFFIKDLINKNVISTNNEPLGRVENLLISRNGEVSYLLVSPARGLKGEGQMVAVPWRAANPSVRGDQIALSVTRGQLESAPTFSPSNLSRLQSPETQQQVNSYFGIAGRMQPGMRPETEAQPQGELGGKDRQESSAQTPSGN